MSNCLRDIFGTTQFVHRQRPTQRISVRAQELMKADPSKVITHSETGHLCVPREMPRPGKSKRVTPATDLDAGDRAYLVQVPGQPTAYFSNKERADAYYWREHDKIEARKKEIERRIRARKQERLGYGR